MENGTSLPFKVGEEAEARSFQTGFRGAWFRCKIREVTKRKGKLGHVSEYYDFPDEKMKWTKLYQVPPYFGRMARMGKDKRELMLRPHYPPIYNEKQMPPASEISEVIVIVDNTWKVGDLVDWWSTGCYWSGSITQLSGHDRAEIELNPPPLGEGLVYDVFLKDLRPSLDWSPEHGWTLPTREGDTGRPCARLVKPINQVIGRIPVENNHNSGQETDAVQRSGGSSARFSHSRQVSSDSAVSDEVKSKRTTKMQKRYLGASKELQDEKEKSMGQGCGDSSKRKTSQADSDSVQSSVEPAAEEDLKSDRSHENYRTGEACILNSTGSDTLEAAIMDLEEYLNKVKWLKKILQCGISSSDAERPQWEFAEPNATSEFPK